MKKIFGLFIVLALLVGSVSAYVFPSTNQLNKDGLNPLMSGVGPHVNLVEATSENVTLEFIMPYGYLACFEYRSDGEPSQYGNIYPHPVIAGDYYYYYKCINASTSPFVKTFSANEYVEVRSAFGGERNWDFDWTRFDVAPQNEVPEFGLIAGVVALAGLVAGVVVLRKRN